MLYIEHITHKEIKMSVSFTGINNVKILKKKPYLQSYVDMDNAVPLVKKNEEIKLRFTMTNDAKGNDIDEFNNAVSKGLALKSEKVPADKGPVDMSILIKRSTFPQEEFKPAENQFIVNETVVPLNKVEDLGMFTYLAKLTREMGVKQPDLTPVQKESIEEINGFVADEAIKFIER